MVHQFGVLHAQVGTAKKASNDEFDDEFDYAFEGGEREGGTHKQVDVIMGGKKTPRCENCLLLVKRHVLDLNLQPI
jgi:hypothetical protein